MTDTQTPPKQRTITLTGRRPVTIREDEWPLIADAADDSYSRHADAGRYEQARRQGELTTWWLKVRQHEDGRALVYGRVTPGWTVPEGMEAWAGGELLPAGADLAQAIQRVGADGRLPAATIRACIADLPAEEL